MGDLRKVTTREVQKNISKLLHVLPFAITRYEEVVAMVVEPGFNDVERLKKINKQLVVEVERLEGENERLEELAMGSHVSKDLDEEHYCQYPFGCKALAVSKVDYAEFSYDEGEVKYKKLWLCDKHSKVNEKNKEAFDAKR